MCHLRTVYRVEGPDPGSQGRRELRAGTPVPGSWQIELLASGKQALSLSGLASWPELSILRTSGPFPAQPGPALPLGTHYLPCLCQGPGFPGTHLWLRPAPWEGGGTTLVYPRLGLSGRQQGWTKRSLSTPVLSSLCPSAASASGPPPLLPPPCRCVDFIIWGLREGGTVTWKHLVPLSGLVPQPFPMEVEAGQAGPFESGR